MDADTIGRREHEEFKLRMEEENERQNKRIALLEKSVSQINELTISVKEMAVNMGNMLKELEKQGKRLEALEKEPAETHRQVKTTVITTVIGTVVGALVGVVLTLL